MGPVKHIQDNGLDNRKLAYECLSNVIHLGLIEMEPFMEKVVQGLQDSNNEVKMLVHSILITLCTKSPNSLSSTIDTIMPLLEVSLFTVTKENAVKQEVEKNKQLVESALKTVTEMDLVLKEPNWTRFVAKIQHSTLATMFQQKV
jgi:cullin-associated NEDD8-dissociated protein 1